MWETHIWRTRTDHNVKYTHFVDVTASDFADWAFGTWRVEQGEVEHQHLPDTLEVTTCQLMRVAGDIRKASLLVWGRGEKRVFTRALLGFGPQRFGPGVNSSSCEEWQGKAMW